MWISGLTQAVSCQLTRLAVEFEPFNNERHWGPVGLYSQFMITDITMRCIPESCKPATQQFTIQVMSIIMYHLDLPPHRMLARHHQGYYIHLRVICHERASILGRFGGNKTNDFTTKKRGFPIYIYIYTKSYSECWWVFSVCKNGLKFVCLVN